MAEHYLQIGNKRYQIPRSAAEARDLGWHHGVNYKSFFEVTRMPGSKPMPEIEEVLDWCRENFDPHVYCELAFNVWFLNEEDAIACKLRWS